MNKSLINDAAIAHAKKKLGAQYGKDKKATDAIESDFKSGAEFLFKNFGDLVGSPALALAINERAEQIHKHGRTLAHDKANNANGELQQAALALLDESTPFPVAWNGNKDALQRMYEKDPVQVLTYAATFLIAEADRLTE